MRCVVLWPHAVQVSNTLLITDIVYGKGPGVNTYGMPKGLALKMNKDEEVQYLCTPPPSHPRTHTHAPSHISGPPYLSRAHTHTRTHTRTPPPYQGGTKAVQ